MSTRRCRQGSRTPRAPSKAASFGSAHNDGVYDFPMLRAFFILLLVAPAVWAQQYRWVDEAGRVHYTDTPPPPSAKSAQKKNLKGSELGQQESYEMTEATRKA